jgi:hypothetical protein
LLAWEDQQADLHKGAPWITNMHNVQPSKSIDAKVHKPYRFEFRNIIMREEGKMSPK